MKTLSQSFLAAIIILIIMLSCRNESRENASEGVQDDTAMAMAEDMGAALPTLPYIAFFDETSEQLEADKNPDFDQSLLTVEALTQALIANYPEIPLEVDKVSNDTLYLRITDAQYLTQQMGSSGAQMYLLEATYAYTEIPDIRVVHFIFAEGDHALPGNYTRNSFREGRIIR